MKPQYNKNDEKFFPRKWKMQKQKGKNGAGEEGGRAKNQLNCLKSKLYYGLRNGCLWFQITVQINIYREKNC